MALDQCTANKGKSIAFVSLSLLASENNAQIEKKALAIVVIVRSNLQQNFCPSAD